jgi:hypothetical protein
MDLFAKPGFVNARTLTAVQWPLSSKMQGF